MVRMTSIFRSEEATRKWLDDNGLLGRADEWLKGNPPPFHFQGGRYQWAALEMTIWPWEAVQCRKKS